MNAWLYPPDVPDQPVAAPEALIPKACVPPRELKAPIELILPIVASNPCSFTPGALLLDHPAATPDRLIASPVLDVSEPTTPRFVGVYTAIADSAAFAHSAAYMNKPAKTMAIATPPLRRDFNLVTTPPPDEFDPIPKPQLHGTRRKSTLSEWARQVTRGATTIAVISHSARPMAALRKASGIACCERAILAAKNVMQNGASVNSNA